MMERGLFISFEGGDGAGKSTQINLIKDYLKGKGFDVYITREPGGTPIGEKIRDILLDKDNSSMTDMTEMLLYAASRAQHVNEVILPLLNKGTIVITDRYVDSSFAYQAYARGLGKSVYQVNDFVVSGCMPDVTFFLKLNPEIGRGRISDQEADRIELEKIDFHKRVFAGYLKACEDYPDRIVSIDADKSIEDIQAVIRAKVEGLLNDF